MVEMKKSENLFWIIVGTISIIYIVYTDPFFFSQMEHTNGIVSYVEHCIPPLFYLEDCDVKFQAESQKNDSIVQKMHKGDMVEVWYYKIPDSGSYQFGHFFGEPYNYLVTQLKVNGEMKIEYSFMLTNWLFTLFILFVTVYNTIRFIQKTKNNGTKEKEMLTINQKVSIPRRLPK